MHSFALASHIFACQIITIATTIVITVTATKSQRRLFIRILYSECRSATQSTSN